MSENTSLPGLGGGQPEAAGAVTLQSASTQVANILRREIQSGEHVPLTRLRQRDVAARLGVSTTPVREAFQVLHAEGFLVVENHRGAIVVEPSTADLREGYAIRTALERLAIRETALHFDAAGEPSLRELLERMRSAAAKDKWAAMDIEFHHRLNEMARMPKLLGLINNLRGGVAFYIESAFEDGAQRAAADHDHVALLDACARGDADLAEQVIVAHLEQTGQAVIDSLASRSDPN